MCACGKIEQRRVRQMDEAVLHSRAASKSGVFGRHFHKNAAKHNLTR